MHQDHKQNTQGHGKFMKWGMVACCTLMFAPAAVFLIGGGTSGLWSNMAIVAPLLLCAGSHLVMHRMMGRSCHGGKEQMHSAPQPVAIEDMREEFVRR